MEEKNLKSNSDKNESLWTGFIDLNQIDELLCKNKEIREEFKTKLEEIEEYYRTIRQLEKEAGKNDYIIGNMYQYLDRLDKLKIIYKAKREQLSNWITNPRITQYFNIEIYQIYLLRKYENMKNSKNLEYEAIPDKEKIEVEKELLNNHYTTAVTFNHEQKKYEIKRITTIEREENKLIYRKRFETIIDQITTKENREQILNLMFRTVELGEICNIVSERNIRKYGVNLINNMWRCVYQNYLLGIGIDSEDLNDDELCEYMNNHYDYTKLELHCKSLRTVIEDNIDLIDLNKFLLLCINSFVNSFYAIRDGNNEKIEEMQEETNKVFTTVEPSEFIKRMKTIMKLVDKILKSNIINKKTEIEDYKNKDENNKPKRVSLKDFEGVKKYYVDGFLLTDELKLGLNQIVYDGGANLEEFTDNAIKRLDFFEEEILKISFLDFYNFKRFYNIGLVDKEFIKRVLKESSKILKEIESIEQQINEAGLPEKQKEQISKNISEFLKNIFEEKIIGYDDLIEMYEEKIIDTKQIDSLLENKTEEERKQIRKELVSRIGKEKLLDKYYEYVEGIVNEKETGNAEQKVESKREQKDLSLIFIKKYELSKLSEEEKEEYIDDLVIRFCIEKAEQDQKKINEFLREIYKDGIITLEKIKELDGSYYKALILDVMLVRGELTLDDTSEIRKSLSEDEIKKLLNEAFKNPNINENQRFILVMNMLYKDEDEKLRKEYLNKLTFERFNEKKQTQSGEMKRQLTGSKKTNREYIYPVNIKWQFLNALDKNAIITKYSNGYVEVKSEKLGVRVIEKYFDVKTNNNYSPAYGVATYVIDEEEYRGNEKELIKIDRKGEPQLNDTILRLIVPKTNRIRHNTKSSKKNWMREITMFFNIELTGEKQTEKESRYSQEELKNLSKIITQYEEKYIEIIR